MTPPFRLQIVDKHGEIVTLHCNCRLELDFLERISEAVAKRGVGFGVREADVLTAVRDSIAEVIWDLKRQSTAAVT